MCAMETATAKQKSEERRNFMLEENLIKVIFVVALPQVLNMLIDSLYNMLDAYFVSGIGDAAIAAVGRAKKLKLFTILLTLYFTAYDSIIINQSII